MNRRTPAITAERIKPFVPSALVTWYSSEETDQPPTKWAFAARCTTASTPSKERVQSVDSTMSPITTPSVTYSGRGRSTCSAARTKNPDRVSASQRNPPTKPVAPVTSIRLMAAADDFGGGELKMELSRTAGTDGPHVTFRNRRATGSAERLPRASACASDAGGYHAERHGRLLRRAA